MAVRFPVRDQIAIVGVGTTGFIREGGTRTANAMAIEAAKKAVLDAGLTAKDIDGLAGASWNVSPPPLYMQAALGIPEITWATHHIIPFSTLLISAMNAVFSGVCTTALVYHTLYRLPALSRSAANDPFRQRAVATMSMGGLPGGKTIPGLVTSYSGWMNRYMHEYGATREDFGRLAISNRSNAMKNPYAALRTPLTMEDYLAARMVREPMCMLDMDMPIDGADAVVVTTAERARDLAKKPVLIHAATFGQTDHPEDDQTLDLNHMGKNVVVKHLWQRSELTLDDIDIFFPYDGFSIIMMSDTEFVGYCKRGEGPDFIKQHWDAAENRIKINGKIVVNPHGGALSEGGTQGSGHIREAVLQLRGEAGERQSPGVKHALLTPGSLFFNPTGLIFRTE